MLLAAAASPSSETPLWVTLLVGLGGALIGGLATLAGQWQSTRSQERRERERGALEAVRWKEQEQARLQGVLFTHKQQAFARVNLMLQERKTEVIQLINRHDTPHRRMEELNKTLGWHAEFRLARADAELLEPGLLALINDASLYILNIESEAGAKNPFPQRFLGQSYEAEEHLRSAMRQSMGVLTEWDQHD